MLTWKRQLPLQFEEPRVTFEDIIHEGISIILGFNDRNITQGAMYGTDNRIYSET